MATPLSRKKDAHYHALKATQEWAKFRDAMAETVKRAAAERAARERQRERETTYARGQLGGH